MLRPRLAPVLVVMLALVVLGVGERAWAHGAPSAVRFVDVSASSDALAPAAEAQDEGRPGSAPVIPPASPDHPWPVLLFAGLVGVAFAVHRRRRGLALALVLLLLSFAFEVGVHSVHHGTDPGQIAACAAAAAAAHLAATPVDAAASVEAILPAVASTPELNPSSPLTCLTRPDQGRAPPA